MRANNERPGCSFKAQQIFLSVVGIQKKFNMLILLSNILSSQVLMLDTG